MKTLAIDPGIDTGWAVFHDFRLESCGLGDPTFYQLADLATWQTVIERPQVYDRAHSKGDPNDLITLAIQVGRYAERSARQGVEPTLVLPKAWKGQLPKDVCAARIRKHLTGPELAVLDETLRRLPEGKRHNVTDAVGIGKWFILGLSRPL